MNINADDTQRVVLNHHDLPWIASPQSGIERRMLERQGDEVAKATSIVRYQGMVPGLTVMPLMQQGRGSTLEKFLLWTAYLKMSTAAILQELGSEART
jgi:hypothetical protein